MSDETAIPLLDLKSQYASIREELLEAARRVMDSGAFILGPEGRAFEAEFAKALGAARCAGVSSGTQALQLSLEASGVGPGDDVAVPALTFIATASAVSELGARPVFVDVEPASLTMDPADLARRLTPRTKAVVPVHLYGGAADMDPILALAREKKLGVVEDCAQAHSCRYKGRSVGTFGQFGAFSFYPSKNLGALGDAGAGASNDAVLLDTVLMLRNAGRPAGKQYEHERLGHNARLDDLQAAFLRVKLRRLEAWTEGRRRAASLYRRELAGLPLRLPPEDRDGGRHVFHLFVVQTERRDALAEHLRGAGISTGVYYPVPLHLTQAYRGLGGRPGDLPQSERASKEVLALPMYPELEAVQVERVVRAVRAFFK